VNFRRESPADIPAIHSVVLAAFGQPGEADLVSALRRAGALTLSAIATIDDRIVGHVAYSPILIRSESQVAHALALAPVAVSPDFQRQGIGSGLVRWSLDECRRAGHQLVIVVGEPAYYHRFGFVEARPHGIKCPFEVPSEAFMLLELAPNAARGCAGTVEYHPAFAAL
jgi:putative acetyltransferase